MWITGSGRGKVRAGGVGGRVGGGWTGGGGGAGGEGSGSVGGEDTGGGGSGGWGVAVASGRTDEVTSQMTPFLAGGS